MLSFGLIYWIIMLLWLIFGVWTQRGPDGKWSWPLVGGTLILWILLLLLGWKVFGAPLRGE